MQERAINISSINRQKIGRSSPQDFTIKFDPVMLLDTEMHHELAVDRVDGKIFVRKSQSDQVKRICEVEDLKNIR